MNKLLIIVKHEFRQITRGKIFIIMTMLGPLLFGALTFLPSYFAMKSTEPEKNSIIAIYCEDNKIITYISESFREKNLILIEASNEAEGKQFVIDEEAKGFVNIPSNLIETEKINYYSTTGTDFQYSKEVRDSIRDYIYDLKKVKLGLSTKDSEWLSERVEIKSLKISDDGGINNSDYISVMIVTMAIGILIMMTSLIYGLSSARSILLEKSSMTLEILLSSVDSTKILMGKVLGAAAAGIIQFTVWITMALLLAKIAVPVMNLDFSTDMLTVKNITVITIFFLLGFFLYLLIYTAIGANVENEQTLGQAQIPLQIILMMPLIVNGAIVSSPNTMFTKILSYLPFTSPSAMSARLLIDSPGLPAIIVSMLILIISLVGILVASSKMFNIGILTKGKKIKLPQLIKLLFS